MYTAYLDETGQQGNDWVFVAGFVGDEAAWTRFVPLWKAGLRNRTTLHMRELRWKHRRTKDLLARLGPIPRSCGLEPVVGGVKVSDYKDLVKGSIVEKIAEGYLYCLFPLVLCLLKYLPRNGRVEFIFGSQTVYRDRAIDLMDFIAQQTVGKPQFCTPDGLSKIAKFSFLPPGDHLLLQPSDYYASAMAHYHHDKQSQKAQWCMPILDVENNIPCIGKILNREEIRAQIIRSRQELMLDGLQLSYS
jgi:hypothetical protein